MDIVGNVKSAYELVRNIQKDFKDARLQRALSELLFKLNDMLSQIGDIHMTTLKLQEENDRLRRENNQLKSWDSEKEHYVLKQLGSGGFVYVARDAGQKTDGEIGKDCYLCANCFKQKRKSILQFSSKGFDGTHYVCSCCGAKVVHPEARAEGDIWVIPTKNKWDGFV